MFLPELKTELESLRARVTELSQLIGEKEVTQLGFTTALLHIRHTVEMRLCGDDWDCF